MDGFFSSKRQVLVQWCLWKGTHVQAQCCTSHVLVVIVSLFVEESRCHSLGYFLQPWASLRQLQSTECATLVIVAECSVESIKLFCNAYCEFRLHLTLVMFFFLASQNSTFEFLSNLKTTKKTCRELLYQLDCGLHVGLFANPVQSSYVSKSRDHAKGHEVKWEMCEKLLVWNN